MKRGLAIAAVLVGVMAAPRRARAVDVWANLGVSEVLTLPDPEHYAVYLYLAVTFPIDLGWQQIYLIPGAGFEIAPEVESGGFTGYLTAERVLSGSVAADVILTLVHDQPGLSWDDATFSVGVGGGVSITIGKGALSPSLSFYRTIGSSGAWSVAPVINLAYPF